jgi:uncharacterized protein YyaL (SSP411 family)
MTMFLTPEGVPFYGGTYFPPQDRYNMPGFRRVLSSVADAYKHRPSDVQQTATSLLSELQKLGAAQETGESFPPSILEDAFKAISRSFDPGNGGFGGAPKFPAPMTIEFLLRTFHRTGAGEALAMATQTCRKMANGGIYDQLGGGFHRYSTDAHWLVPHFEKMLYDNAQLVLVYLQMFQITGDQFYAKVARDTLNYVSREMTGAGGGFFSTQDADSEGHEGKFFIWTVEEIRAALPVDEAEAVIALYEVTDSGNFEGSNILNIPSSIEEVAKSLQTTPEQLQEKIERARKTLFQVRDQRVKPATDEKILTAWNGLMIEAFAEAGAILDEPTFLKRAIDAADFVLENMRADGLLLRTFKDGKAKLNAYLEDYADFANSLVTLYERTGQRRWLDEALSIVNLMIEEFWDDIEGGFYFTGKSHESLIVRNKDFLDNATPSGNSVAATLLLRLSALTGDETYRRKAVTIFRLLAGQIRRYPSAFGRLLCALDFHLSAPKEVVIIGDPAAEETRALRQVVWDTYLPGKVVVLWDGSEGTAPDGIELLKNRGLVDGRPTAYVCENFTCRQPTTDPVVLRRQLEGQ